MAAALANRAMGAIVGSAVADAAGNKIKCLSHCSFLLYLKIYIVYILHIFPFTC